MRKRKMFLSRFIVAMFVIALYACSTEEPKKPTDATSSTFTDSRDGNVYKYVKIGNQIWMAENLRYLPSVVGPGTGSQITPCYYVYGYDGTSVAAAKATANYTTYGVLYNYTAACNSCPDGWHLPSEAEWAELVQFVNTTDNAGFVLRSTSGWYDNLNGTDDYVFTALPGGGRGNDGSFHSIGKYGDWWSATEDNAYASRAWGRTMKYDNSDVNSSDFNKQLGFSVRCVRD